MIPTDWRLRDILTHHRRLTLATQLSQGAHRLSDPKKYPAKPVLTLRDISYLQSYCRGVLTVPEREVLTDDTEREADAGICL